ncbi:MAG: hypothetical protein AB8C84_11965 [Oligoflexales bacterium]
MTGFMTLILSIAALFESNPVEQKKKFERIWAMNGCYSQEVSLEKIAYQNLSSSEESDCEEEEELKALLKKKQ